MIPNLTSELVWAELEKQLFAVLGMVTAQQEARTVGVVYVVHQRKLYITTRKDTWKARHLAQNPHVSLTVPIARRIPFLPWIKIPAATITFPGRARLLSVDEVPADLLAKLYRGLELEPEIRQETAVIEVQPEKSFVTYGVGVSTMTMRHPEKSRGRVSVNGGQPAAGDQA